MTRAKLRIAVHKGCVGKTNPDKVAHGWANILETTEWLEGWIKKGYGWCATHFVDKHRLEVNSDGSNVIALDIDGDTTLGRFWATRTARNWCECTYTSSSHSEHEHRFRALFPLNVDLKTVAEHRAVYWFIVKSLLKDLGLESLKDNAGQKPERLWYGNPNAEFKWNTEFAPLEQWQMQLEEAEESNFIKTDAGAMDIERCKWLLKNFITPSEDGEYETKYVPVLAACASLGEDMFDDWVDWVLRGHHGEKESNTKAFKWRGIGDKSDFTSLYGIAKKQDPDWVRKLPSRLRFSAQGNAAGYGEADPIPQLPGQSTSGGVNQSSASSSAPRGRRSNNTLANERVDDVNKVKDFLDDLRKNELTNALEYTSPSGKKKVLEGNALDLMTTRLAVERGQFIPEARIKSAICYAAELNSYCPIKRYLDCCERTAKPHADWDRLGEVLLNNPHQLATLTLQRMLIGAVARGYDPGCELSWIPILVGPQGVGKSMLARSLVPADLFAEISTPLETLQREMYRLHTGWLLELPEIDSYFTSKNIESFKNLVTTRTDEVRRPYDRLPEKLKRRFCMIGTTNRNQFLIDSTGNRRFIPLEIGAGWLIPWAKIKEERDSIWAAAIAAYRSGAQHEFTAGEVASLSDYIAEFGDPDPWVEKISDFIRDKSEVRAADVLTKALDLDPKSQDRRASRRVADVLQTMGWRRMVTSRKDPFSGKSKSVRLWVRPADDPIDESHIMTDF